MWSGQAKAICQWMNAKGHRKLLVDILKRHGMGDMSAPLESQVNSFAKWRWGTLAAVLRSLADIQTSLTSAIGCLTSPKDLACREGGQATALVDAVRCPLF